MTPRRLAVTTMTALVLVVGCTAARDGNQPEEGPSASSTARPTSVSTAAPSPTASASPSAPNEPTPSPTLPEVKADRAAVRQALVTAADLGKPWVEADGPAETDEACPGTRSAVARLAWRAEDRRGLTRGAGELVNGAIFGLATLPGADASKVRDAWRTDTGACREHTDPDDYYVVYRELEPTPVRGADEVVFRRIERVYFDRGDEEPAYARHTLVARSGRVVTTLTYSFLTSESDPEATDFSAATELLQTQLGKAASAFPK